MVLIGNGQACYIKPFKKDTGYDGQVFTDPSLKTYTLLNFKKGLTSLFGLKSMTAGLRAATTGYAKVRIQGSTNQQGGVVIIGPEDIVYYLYRNKEMGDFFSIDDILKVYN